MCQDYVPKESFLSYKLDFFKELYNIECERRKFTHQKISRIIPLIVAMFGADAYIIIKIGEQVLQNGFLNDIKSISLYILCVITLIAGCIVLLYMFKSFLKFNIKTFDPDKHKTMFEVAENQIIEDGYEKTLEEINEKIYKEYVKITTNLSKEIDDREKYISKLYISLITNCLLTCFTLIVIFI